MLRRPGIAPLVPSSRNKADRQRFSVVSGVLVGQKNKKPTGPEYVAFDDWVSCCTCSVLAGTDGYVHVP